MKEKIDWYQEVLDLEPGSKVFFPLAKLLVQNNELSRAIDTLQHGLDRHPEYIEARLYLVELLHQQGDIKSKIKLDEHLAFLVPLLERYAGFWQAWSSTKSGDSKLAISFLAAIFQNNSLTLSEIFNKGLQAVDADTKASQASSGSSGDQGAHAHTVEQDISDAEENITEEALADTVAADAVSGDALVNVLEADPAEKLEADTLLGSELSDHKPVATEPSVAALSLNQQAMQDLVDSYSASKAELTEDAMADEDAADGLQNDDVAPQEIELAVKKPKITISINKQPMPVAEAEDDLLDEDEEGEERFSLRTRSMAEVLAEQGDYAGALEIYQELIANATSPQEKEDLQYRVSTLSAYIGDAQEKTVVEEGAAKAAGKDRILSVLETLAVRLESRVQS